MTLCCPLMVAVVFARWSAGNRSAGCGFCVWPNVVLARLAFICLCVLGVTEHPIRVVCECVCVCVHATEGAIDQQLGGFRV